MGDFTDKAAKIAECAERLRIEACEPGFLKRLLTKTASVWALITRIPLPRGVLPRGFALPDSDAVATMPLAGALFGLVCALPARIAAMAIAPPAAAWIGCGIYTILGWSLHLDGWGDLWDGVGSGLQGERMRKVMKDSGVGAFGVAGIALAISTRAALLSGLDAGSWMSACAIGGGVGRFALAVTAYAGKYPWDDGMGRDIVRGFEGYQLFCSFAAACVLFPLAPLGWTVGMFASGISGAACAMWGAKNLGGANGDVLGASAVLGELLALMACSLYATPV
ncbi:MAG: adenosylcobinamide-GDP ribazoletransferase [Synergistaceae bacterium]|jgi:adenosylcobinamide-GDP ribazoletransferase|nr:adenosylcobinamide-GDP ribazoletransferase [Synergistaceae bacterium]